MTERNDAENETQPENSQSEAEMTEAERHALHTAEVMAWEIISPTTPQPDATDSAEFRATTFVIDGKPMSFDEMVAYHAEKQRLHDEATLSIMKIQADDDELRRREREEHKAEFGYDYGKQRYGEGARDFAARLRSEGRDTEADAVIKAFEDSCVADGRDPKTGLKNTRNSDML